MWARVAEERSGRRRRHHVCGGGGGERSGAEQLNDSSEGDVLEPLASSRARRRRWSR